MNAFWMFLKKPVVAITLAVVGGIGAGVVASRFMFWRKSIIVGNAMLDGMTAEQKKAKVEAVISAQKAKAQAVLDAQRAKAGQPAQPAQAA